MLLRRATVSLLVAARLAVTVRLLPNGEAGSDDEFDGES